MDADAARHRLRAAWRVAALRLSRLLPLRLLDQRQAEPAGDLHSRARCGRAPRSATWPWWAASRRDRTAARRACTIIREGRWRFQKARNVVVAGYAIETPRLLLASATDRYPDGLANSSGLVGKNLMTQSNQAVFGSMQRRGALVQGAAVARHHRALELRRPQGFRRRLLLDGAGAAADRMGDRPDQLSRPLGPGAARRDGEIQSPGRPEDGGRDAAGRAQPRDPGRRDRPDTDCGSPASPTAGATTTRR